MLRRQTEKGCSGADGKKISQKYPEFESELEKLVEAHTRGDPERKLRWVSKSTRKLSRALKDKGIEVSARSVLTALRKLGYRLQGNRKIKNGEKPHPDRNAQFEYIARETKRALKAGNPVISVDTKKKEALGTYKNSGKQWFRKGNSPAVQDHDFISPETPKAYPYGIYDIKQNRGFVNVGTDHDTSKFAVASIRAWWNHVGFSAYQDAKYVLILADGGGSNGSHRRQWKFELDKLAREIGLPIHVCHYPPGTSKWNKVEHRLFSHISMNWRGIPLTDYKTLTYLIRNTTTQSGLKVQCRLDRHKYKSGIKISNEQMASLNIRGASFHNDWNYQILPFKL
jgi:hypothetical protein